jgi:tetratricopeptide (TPR) repeat protein
VRNGLNDQLTSFVFTLGFFLRQHGFTHLWRQLVADAGTVKPERALALLRYDLAQAAALPLLICVDDLEVLQPERTDHNQILHVLEELCQSKSVLLISQRPLVSTDEQINLNEFTREETSLFLAQAVPVELDQTIAEQIQRNTRGNAAMLTLFLALLRGGESLANSLALITDAPSLESLFYRIWRRLSEPERFLLMRLAVFRTPSPRDAWVDQQAVLQSLLQRQLVSFDRQGGVNLFSHIRQLVYEHTPSELRAGLHLQAANIRSTRRERIAAIYHYWQARQPTFAIWEWFPNRRSEIERGHGAAALKILIELIETDLPDERDQNALRVSLAELLQLTGRPEEAEAKLASIRGAANDPFYAYVAELQADLLEMRGQLEQAATRYRSALDTFTRVIDHREVIVHTKLVFLHLYRLHNVEQARIEALQARAKAEAFHGLIEEMAGNYALARQLYESARQLAADSGNDLVTLSRIYTYTSSLLLKQGEYEAAVTLIKKAIECDRKRGDSVGPLYDIMNLAYVYTLAGRYDEAYQHALNGLHMAEKMNHSYLIAGLAAGVGEACYYLQRLEDAEFYALQSLNEEEEFFRSWALVLLGMVRHKQGRSADGINLAQQGVTAAQQIDDKYVEAYAKRVLADIYRDTAQDQQAITAYHSALQIYTALKLDRESKPVQEALAMLGVSVNE